MVQTDINDDFEDLLRAFTQASVEFVIVGAYALAAHGVPRATGDIDIFIRPTAANASRVVAALRAFGAPLDAHIEAVDVTNRGAAEHDLGTPSKALAPREPPAHRADFIERDVHVSDSRVRHVPVRDRELKPRAHLLGRPACARESSLRRPGVVPIGFGDV